MYALSYWENNTFCILILVILLVCHQQNPDFRPSSRYFRGLLTSMIFYAAIDMACGLQENQVFSPPRWVVAVMNVLFFYASGAVVYLGLLYSECELGAKWLHSPKKRLLSALPIIVLLITVPLSLRGKFYFYIDAEGRYTKGPLYPLLLALCYGYLLVIGIRALAGLLSKHGYARQMEYLAMGSLVVLPLVGGIAQAHYTGVSIICLATTVAAVQVFVNLQQTRITIDPLTQLNNRTKLIQYLDKCVSHQRSGTGRHLALCMIDINDFKQINDRFGHPEGDAALILLAETLKQAGAHFKCLIARYGGDEFFVVLETKSPQEVSAFRQELLDTLARNNAQAAKPYNVEISLGFADYDPQLTIPELIERTDRALYNNKGISKSAKRRAISVDKSGLL